MGPVIAFKPARWSALIKTSLRKREPERGEDFIIYLPAKGAFPTRGWSKGAKHLVSGGVKDGHFKRGWEREREHNHRRQQWKPFDVQLLDIFAAQILPPVSKSGDTKSRFQMCALKCRNIKNSILLIVKSQPALPRCALNTGEENPVQAAYINLSDIALNFMQYTFIASIMHIYIMSTHTCTDSRMHTHTYKKSIECVSPRRGYFAWVKDNTIPFFFSLFLYNTSFSSAFCVHEIHFLMEIFVL